MGRSGALGDFLRARRGRLDPGTLGLGGDGRRRRTPGLRREEVAERAGIGTDWYVRLEQGRDVHPSPGTVKALARALCLDAAEHAHLRALARGAPVPAFGPEHVPDTVRRLVRGLPGPAYVTGRRWDVLCWNEAAAGLLVDFDRLPAADRNILVFMFLLPEGRTVFGTGWEAEARRMVAQFRPNFDLWAGDPAFAALRERLERDSPEFAALWAAHEVRGGGTGTKRLHHPRSGERRFEYATFQCNEDPGLKLALYAPGNAPA
ncbi:MAG: helix-turn-helix domain-containing protein [Gluconacetobacter diazotrophicus]|nr:helix-turn-helix domain-containing protein [Gluconacetobacter diazotrophicus]